jgi:hypothetical protein
VFLQDMYEYLLIVNSSTHTTAFSDSLGIITSISYQNIYNPKLIYTKLLSDTNPITIIIMVSTISYKIILVSGVFLNETLEAGTVIAFPVYLNHTLHVPFSRANHIREIRSGITPEPTIT